MNTPLHIVLYQPEIPPNTGNIARLCACTGSTLHLVHPLGFCTDDRTLKRAGLDYWPYLDIREYADWTSLRRELPVRRDRMFALTTKAEKSIWECAFRPGDALVFGPETRGLPPDIRAGMQALRIPIRTDAPVRSLNLSTACGVAVYEALRQILTADYPPHAGQMNIC